MRNAVGAISLALILIGVPGTLESLSQWRGLARFVLGESYGPISEIAGLTLLLVFVCWGRTHRRPSHEEGLPRTTITSNHQSGGQTGVFNFSNTSVTNGRTSGMTAEERAHREKLADELDGHGHTFFKRVEEWYTARVKQLNPDQAEQKEAEARDARAQAEIKLNELDRFLAEKVNRGAASYFKRNKPDEPDATPYIKHIKEGLAINSMKYRSKRLDEKAARVRSGEEPIRWPLS
jgi:hypothetical protein